MTTFWPKRDEQGRHVRSTTNPKCPKRNGFVRYRTFDYKKGVYIITARLANDNQS